MVCLRSWEIIIRTVQFLCANSPVNNDIGYNCNYEDTTREGIC